MLEKRADQLLVFLALGRFHWHGTNRSASRLLASFNAKVHFRGTGKEPLVDSMMLYVHKNGLFGTAKIVGRGGGREGRE